MLAVKLLSKLEKCKKIFEMIKVVGWLNDQGLEHYKERLKSLGLPCLEKRVYGGESL